MHPETVQASGRWHQRDVNRIAARQRGLVTYDQIIELGIGRSAVARAVSQARLHRLHRGVYAVAPLAALPSLAAEHAAILACGSGTLLSHRSAAALWGMRPSPDGVEVTVVGHQRGRKCSGIHVHRATRLERGDVRRLQGLPVTAAARTLLDIATLLAERELERTVDEAIAQRIVSRSAVLAATSRYPRAGGAAVLRGLCDTDTISRSTGEKELLKLIRAAGLPLPETNAKVGRFEVDFLWRREQVAVELDGYAYHSSRASLERDHAKDMTLQAAGIFVLRISGRQLAARPEMALAWIVAAVTRGADTAAA